MLAKLIIWFGGARWRLSLSHCLEGLLIQLPVALLCGAPAGVLAVVVWYWSRKKLEVEELHGHATDPAASWGYGWFPWTWDKWQVLDVVLPSLSSAALALLSLRLSP